MELIHIALALSIFLARVIDVSLGTIRFIFISKGYKRLAPILGFFEILIWIIAIKELMSSYNSPLIYVAYAAGFATGNFIGIIIEDKLSIGRVMVRVITKRNPEILIENLRRNNYPMTIMDAKGRNSEVKIIISVIKKKRFKRFIRLIRLTNPDAFYSVEDVRQAKHEDFLPVKRHHGVFGNHRKSK
jgi:uncharacterized protein YebE (UPF0316 family)